MIGVQTEIRRAGEPTLHRHIVPRAPVILHSVGTGPRALSQSLQIICNYDTYCRVYHHYVAWDLIWKPTKVQ